MSTPKNKKSSTKVIVLRVFAVLFLLFQLLGYAGNIVSGAKIIPDDPAEKIGFFLGYNLFLYIAVGFFFWARSIRKKIKEEQKTESIESIGLDQ